MKKIGILKWLVGLVLVVVLAFFGFTAEVREGECAVITRFGATRAEITEAGLYLRLPWPFEDVVKYDARQQYLESNYLETLTRDKRNIILNSYVVWGISDPLTFYHSVRSADVAEQYIRDLVTNATNGVLGGYDLTELVSLDEEKIKIDEIQAKIFDRVRENSAATYGIEISEVSIMRLTLPDVNLQSVFDQMKTDRQKDIDTIIAEAERDANKITTDADAKAAEIIAQGTTDAAALKAQTETEVARIYAEAQAANLELYQFLRQLDTMAGSVGEGTTLIVRTDEYPFNVLVKYGNLLDGAAGDSTETDGEGLAAALAELPEADREAVTAALWALIARGGGECAMTSRTEKRSLFGDILAALVKAFRWIVVVVLIAILCSGIRTVQTGEVAIILRFGRLLGDTREEQIHEPGLLFAFPYIIDEVITVPTGKVFELTVDTHNTSNYMSPDVRENGYIITGDQNIALVSASVKYTISDPVAYALNSADVTTTLHGVVSGALATGAVAMDIDELLTTGKDDYGAAVMTEAQKKADVLGLGVTLSSLELKTVSTPLEVKSIFESVNAAKIESETILNEAKQYYEIKIPAAEAQANALVSAAQAEYASAVAAANDTLSEFRGLLDEYAANPDVVLTRVYSEKLTKILSSIGTIRLLEPGEEMPGILMQ